MATITVSFQVRSQCSHYSRSRYRHSLVCWTRLSIVVRQVVTFQVELIWGPLLTKLSRNCHIYGKMMVLLLRCPSVGTFKDINHEPVTKNNFCCSRPRCNSISLIRKSRFWITGAVATSCRLDIRAKRQAERLWLCTECRILELV